MLSRALLLAVLCLVSSPFFDKAEGTVESEKLSRLKALSPELARRAREKEEELFSLCPELKQHVSRPSKKRILERIRKEKLTRYPPGIAQLIPDTVRVLVIRVEFEEDDTPLTTGNGKMNLRGNDEPMYDEDGGHNPYYDPPHDSLYFYHLMESLHNYYFATSGGRLCIDFDLFPRSDTLSYQLPHQMCYYGDPENYFVGFFTLMRDAIQAADEDTSLHFMQGGFPIYDAYIIFHAGSMYQTDYFWDSPCDIVAAWGVGATLLFGDKSMTTDDGCVIDEAVMYPETAFQDYMVSYLQGGLAHEFGHQLGLLDLYDTCWETMGAGGWALMGTGNWNVSGLVPPHLCAFSSEYLGFTDPVVIQGDSTGIQARYRGSRDTLGTKIVKIPINPREYFLIENRIAWASPDSVGPDPDSSGRRVWKDGVLVSVNDYDFSLPPRIGEGGLAIWHIDSLKVALDTLNKINCGYPKAVDMEEADGIQDFEQFLWQAMDFEEVFFGSPYDLYFGGNNSEFTPNSTPNTNDNQGSNTNILVTNVSSPDTVMTFDLKFDWAQAGFPVTLGLTGDPVDVSSPNICDLDGNDTLDIVIGSTSGWVYAWRSDGYPYTGNLVGRFAFVGGEGTYSSVAAGDLNGDGRVEVVCGAENGRVYAWHADSIVGQQGVYVAGFPVATEANVVSAPLLADIDGDGRDELLVGSNDMKLYAWEIEDGVVQLVAGFPVLLGQWIYASPVAADSTIYALSGDGRLFKLDSRGKELWSLLPEKMPLTTSSPVVGDIDRDGSLEIVVSTGMGDVYMVSEEGELEWKVTIPDTSFYSSPALADLDEDGYLDIVLAAGRSIYGFNSNGATLEGFPIDTESDVDTLPIQSSPVIGDIDGDDRLEVVIGSLDGRILAFENDGRPVRGFPISCGGEVYSTPALIDLDGDGDVELCAGSDDGRLYCWDLDGTYDADNIVWGMLRRDQKHSGRYPDSLLPSLPPPRALAPLSKFYIYPNPVSQSPAVIRYELGRDADRVDIKVFNVAGDLIAELKGKTGRGAQDNRLSLQGIASGLYICRIEVEEGGEKVVRFKKFAVVK